MNGRQVFAMLVRAGDTKPLGVGGLVTPQVALVALDSDEDLGALPELEVLITDGEGVERIKPSQVLVTTLAGTSEPMAGIRLAHTSQHAGEDPMITDDDLGRALEAEQDIWRAVQTISPLGDRRNDADVARALETVRATEKAQQVTRLGVRTASEIAKNCCICSPKCY